MNGLDPPHKAKGGLQGQEEGDFHMAPEFSCSAEIQKDTSQPSHNVNTPTDPSHAWVRPQMKQITQQSSKRLPPPMSSSQN